MVALTSEGSIGAGMRRLGAAVGVEGFAYLARERDLVARIAEQLGAPRAELPEKIAGLLERLKTADRTCAPTAVVRRMVPCRAHRSPD